MEGNSSVARKRSNNDSANIVHEPLDYEPSGWLQTTLVSFNSSREEFVKKNSSAMKIIMTFILNGLVIGFFIGCFFYWLVISKEPLELCYGFGSLIAFLSIVYFFIIYFTIVKRYCGDWFESAVWNPAEKAFMKLISLTGLAFLLFIACSSDYSFSSYSVYYSSDGTQGDTLCNVSLIRLQRFYHTE
ncbi:unnamed protein product [Leptidea sinapis]|uniref:Uncharacterized protein n=1 Tax=Leptidea sinapis TaxID=189913 RepID=A0A5E4Q9U2_9NEOP|nr:unnamed protein product [Leptidea sinapis]